MWQLYLKLNCMEAPNKYKEHGQRMIDRLSKKIPPVLYKYRNWAEPYHQKLITEGQLYFADPISLNDAWDGTNSESLDKLTYERCVELNMELFPISQELTKEGLEKLARKMVENKDGYHPDMKPKDPNPFYESNSIVGIVSLSSQNDNALLWAYYGDGHKGFVTGLDSRELGTHYGQLHLEEIRYVDDYPEIEVGDWDEFRKKYCTKLKSWQHEAEWRLLANRIASRKNLKNRVLTLSESTFKEVIIGAKTTDTVKHEIISVVKTKLPNVVIKQATLNFHGKNKIEFKIIN